MKTAISRNSTSTSLVMADDSNPIHDSRLDLELEIVLEKPRVVIHGQPRAMLNVS